MNQLRYAFEDIVHNKSRSFVFFLQITLSLMLFSFMLTHSFDLQKLIKKITMTNEYKNAYLMFDISDMDKFFNETIYEDDVAERMDNFYLWLTENKHFKSYAFSYEDLILKDNRLDDSLVSFTYDLTGDKCYSGLICNEDFINFFDFRLSKGRLFNTGDYSDTSNIIPVIAGYDYSKYFNLGDVIDSEYRIIGFFEKDSRYYDIKACGDLLSLDKSIVMPFQREKALQHDNLGLYDSIINKTVIITEDERVLDDIQKKSSELGLYTYSFRSVEEQLGYIKESSGEWVLSLFTFCMIILFFCIIGMICNMLQMLNNYIRELGIHILCGASKFSIVIRLFYQVFFLTLLPNIIILFIHGFSSNLLISVLLSVLLSTLVILVPFIRLMKTDMNTILRRSE